MHLLKMELNVLYCNSPLRQRKGENVEEYCCSVILPVADAQMHGSSCVAGKRKGLLSLTLTYGNKDTLQI